MALGRRIPVPSAGSAWPWRPPQAPRPRSRRAPARAAAAHTSAAASTAIDGDHLSSARFLGVVGAAAEHAREPCEEAAAARRLDLAAALLDLGLRQIVARHRLAVRRDEHRLAVGEEARQRLAAHPGPVAHRAAVDVDPREALRIEPHAALLHPHRDVADAPGTDVLEVGVDRLAFHVLRMLGDLPRPSPQHRVGLGRTVG